MVKKNIIQFKFSPEIRSIEVENLPIYEKNANGETEKIDHFLTEEGVCNAIRTYMKHNNLSGTYYDIVVYDEQGNIIAQAENLSERGSLKFTDDAK
ncbi:MAG: hypothetical protein J5529_09650 [Prevotella sp.]|nr:hypothetical protein [Prevotella sp.]